MYATNIDPKQLPSITNLYDNTLYSVPASAKIELDNMLLRLYGGRRSIQVVDVYVKKPGGFDHQLRFIAFGGESAKRILTRDPRIVATAGGDGFIIAQGDIKDWEKAARTAESVVGGRYYVSGIKLSDPRIAVLGLTDEERDEIYDDETFTLIQGR